MSRLEIKYEFHFPDQGTREYRVLLDDVSLEQLRPHTTDLPRWTAIDFHQCPNCSYHPDTHPHCPLAVNLVELVAVCNDLASYDDVILTVTTPERVITAATTVQRGISSLLGLVMATSPCPHTAYLKPMARFHLPLASEEETFYRATSMYLLAQYFLRRDGEGADMDLHGLVRIYRDMQAINQAMAHRLRGACDEDGTVNAIVMLDVLAKAMPHAIDDSLEEIRYLFEPYFKRSKRDVTG